MSDDIEPGERKPRPIPIQTEIEGLIAAARAAFSSEVAFQRARALLASKAVGRIAGFAALFVALVFFLLMALVVGLLLALSPLLGTWQALGVVLLLLAVGMGLAVWAGFKAWRRLKRILFGERPDA